MKDVSLNNLRPVNVGTDSARPAGARKDSADVTAFKELLEKEQLRRWQYPEDESLPKLKFSNHAVDRMQARGVRFSPEEMGKIEKAAAKAAAKGSKECLLITDQAAMIVSLKDKTVVTVMDKNNLKDNVFTNIDATVMI